MSDDKRFKVVLHDGAQCLMYTEHDYRPYAESQAKVWRSLYPNMIIRIYDSKPEEN